MKGTVDLVAVCKFPTGWWSTDPNVHPNYSHESNGELFINHKEYTHGPFKTQSEALRMLPKTRFRPMMKFIVTETLKTVGCYKVRLTSSYKSSLDVSTSTWG